MRKINYKTKVFGDYEDGSIIDAYLLISDGELGLVFHPSVNLSIDNCASLDICRRIELDGVEIWENNFYGEAFVNIDSEEEYKEFVWNLIRTDYYEKQTCTIINT